MKNSISSSALQTTTDYKTSGLANNEIYVWKLVKGSKGFYIRNMSSNKDLSSSGNDLSWDSTNKDWTFNFQTDSTVLIQNTDDKCLGFTSSSSYAYKAYAKSNIDKYPHAIKVYQLKTDVAPVSIGPTGYATFSSTHALDFSSVSDLKAYIATADGTTGVNFTRVYKVPANTGLLLVSASGGAVDATAVPYLTDEADDVKDNVFVAVNENTNVSTTADGKNNYILNVGSHGIGFYQAAGNKVGAGKAYISVPTSATVKGFITLPDNDDETGISTVKATMGNDIIYNLAGLRLGHSPWRRGVLIQNGKKFVVK